LWHGIQEEIERSRHIRAELIARLVATLESDQTRNVRRLIEENIRGLILAPGRPAEIVSLIDPAEGRTFA